MNLNFMPETLSAATDTNKDIGATRTFTVQGPLQKNAASGPILT